MSKKNREYWQKRSEQVQEAILNKSDTYYDDLERIYKLTSMDIQKDIDAWYRRFAKNNCISFVDAKRLLNTNELKEFKWTVNDYINYGERNAVNQYWMEELENASAKVHISRLEALQIQLQQKVEVLFGNQLDGVDKLIKNTYAEGYYHTAFELQKGFNTGFTLQAFNENELDKIVSKPWTTDGTNFSKRIWGEYRPELVNTIHTQLTQTLIRGIAPDKAIKTIAEKFNTTRSRAGNLVMTESAYFSSLSRNDCYNDLHIGDFEIVATLDFKTSDICRPLDGLHFPLKEYEIGVTAPPFHNRCRTTTCPYFDDEFTLGEKRAARGIDGKTHYVDSNIKYPEWKKEFVKESPKSNKTAQTKVPKVNTNTTNNSNTTNTANNNNTITKINDSNNKPKLNQNEKDALEYYTSDGFKKTNERLRNGSELDSTDLHYIKHISGALNKLPNYEGVSYRSVMFDSEKKLNDFISNFNGNKNIEFKEFISSTTDKTAFGNKYIGKTDAQLIINSAAGKDISKYSMHKSEGEVLFDKNSTFEVEEIGKNKFGGTIIKLKQLSI